MISSVRMRLQKIKEGFGSILLRKTTPVFSSSANQIKKSHPLFVLNQKRQRLSNCLWQDWNTENSFLTKKAGNFCQTKCCLKMAPEVPFTNVGVHLAISTQWWAMGCTVIHFFHQFGGNALSKLLPGLSSIFSKYSKCVHCCFNSPHKYVRNYRFRQWTHVLSFISRLNREKFFQSPGT